MPITDRHAPAMPGQHPYKTPVEEREAACRRCGASSGMRPARRFSYALAQAWLADHVHQCPAARGEGR